MSTLNIHNLSKLIIYSLIILIFTTQMSYGASLNLAWDANSELDLGGYKIYYGTSSGNYGMHIDVGKVTEHEISGLNEDTTYYIALTAYDTSDNESEKSDELSGVAQLPPDTQNPTITITSPTSLPTYSTSNNIINIGGTASDNIEVTQVTWSNNRSGSGSASGTTSWAVFYITLQEGNNIITVIASDAVGNTATDSITIIYTLPTTSTTSTTSPTTTTTTATSILIIEAEEMSYHTNGAQVEEYWLLWANGTMNEEVYFPNTGNYRFEIIAKADLAYGVGPKMELLIDGEIKDTVFVNTTEPETFIFDVEISEGTHELAIGFYNDLWNSSEGIDRNLYVDKTIITPVADITSTTTPPTTTTTTIPPTTTTSTTETTTTTTTSVTTTTPVTTTIPSDDTPPSGTIIINNGDKVTHSPNVTLTLFATDDGEELGGNALMTFSNDNQEWSDPEPYIVTKMWTLTTDKGDKTVYVKFRDAAGNWMTEPAKDQIKLVCSQRKLKPISVKASSEFLPFRSKDKAVDENPLTFWSTTPTIFRKNEFITLDLGEIKQISRIDMYALKFLTIDFFPANFLIQISRDNIEWEEVYSEKSYTLKSTHSDSWDLNDLEARYIRIYITKAKTFFIFYLAQIAEIEVYCCDISEQNLILLEDKSSIKDGELRDDIQEEEGEIAELDQMPPSIPGRPMITFN